MARLARLPVTTFPAYRPSKNSNSPSQRRSAQYQTNGDLTPEDRRTKVLPATIMHWPLSHHFLGDQVALTP